jgi:hypothetical protein
LGRDSELGGAPHWEFPDGGERFATRRSALKRPLSVFSARIRCIVRAASDVEPAEDQFAEVEV